MEFLKKLCPVIYVLTSFFSGTAGFFLKHVETGKCIYDTKIVQSRYRPPTGGERTLHFLELSDNCLHPASQFKFLDNGAVLKLNVPGCLQGVYKYGTGYQLHMLYIHTDTHNINDVACVNNNAVTQTSWGGLQIRYDRHGNQFRCFRPRTSKELLDNQAVDPYLKMAGCNFAPKKQFHFGKCYFVLNSYFGRPKFKTHQNILNIHKLLKNMVSQLRKT